jgi:hypothetical protein
MVSQLFFVLFNLGAAFAFSILIARARKDKQLKITLLTSGPVTKVEKIVLRGKGLTVAIIGWGISAILFTYSGLSAFFPQADMEASFFITFTSIFLAAITMLIASYVSTTMKDEG